MIEKIVILALVFPVLTFVGSFCYGLLNKFFLTDSLSESEYRTSSAMIGYLERIIIFTMLILGDQFISIIPIIISLKSLIRFPEIIMKVKNDQEENNQGENVDNIKISAEKFLIGTMFSIIWTIFIFIIFKFILMDIS